MSRDYAKRRGVKRQKPKKNHLLLWIIFLLLGTAFIAGLLTLGKYHRSIRKLTKKTTPEKSTTAVALKAASRPEQTISPKFEFYNILPQKKSNQLEITYELEIAIVNDFAAADNLKARLALLGLVASTTPVYKQGNQKYQITVGPYDNQDGALADLQKLKQNGIKSSLKKINSRN